MVIQLLIVSEEPQKLLPSQLLEKSTIYNENGMTPVVKYYVHEHDRPKFARFWIEDEYPVGDSNFNEDKDVSFL